MKAKKSSIDLPKFRFSLAEAAHVTGLSPNTVREFEARGDFPPRITVPSTRGDGEGRKTQFIAREVEAYANCQDWAAIVAERLGRDWRAQVKAKVTRARSAS